jgi:SAM-dependent methyltransferase
MNSNALISVPCPICSSDQFTVYLPDTLNGQPPVFGYKWTKEVGRSYRYVRCKSCRHIYASPVHKDVFRFYEDVADEGYRVNDTIRRATAKQVLKEILQIKPKGRLLDVGCSTGDFLIEASSYYDAMGLELSSWALRSCKEKKLKVTNKTLKEFSGVDQKKFDVVTMWGVIEHLENPKEEILRAKKLLKKDGILCIWTGDSDSIYAKLFKSRWWYIMGQHLQLFSRSSLNFLMVDAGFDVIADKNYPYVMSVDYLGKRLGGYWFGKPLQMFTNISLWKNLNFKLSMSDQIFSIYQIKRENK